MPKLVACIRSEFGEGVGEAHSLTEPLSSRDVRRSLSRAASLFFFGQEYLPETSVTSFNT